MLSEAFDKKSLNEVPKPATVPTCCAVTNAEGKMYVLGMFPAAHTKPFSSSAFRLFATLYNALFGSSSRLAFPRP